MGLWILPAIITMTVAGIPDTTTVDGSLNLTTIQTDIFSVRKLTRLTIWVVVKIMVPFWVRHLLFRVPKRGP